MSSKIDIFMITGRTFSNHLFLFFFVQHAEMADESIQLKTLQTILIVFQSRLHPEDEVNNGSLYPYLLILTMFATLVTHFISHVQAETV